MHAQRTNIATTEAAQAYVSDLKAALAERGLLVRGSADEKGAFVMARNTESAADDPADAHMNPGLSQVVVLAPRETGEPAWFWQWSGPTRDAPPEYEYLCGADDVEQAVRRLATVLCLDRTTVEQ